MANAGPNTNGSQFFICFGPTSHLNGKHTIFGRVIKNYDFIKEVEQNPTAGQDLPIKQVTILDCGELKGDDKLTRDQADFLKNYEMDDTDSPSDEEQEEPEMPAEEDGEQEPPQEEAKEEVKEEPPKEEPKKKKEPKPLPADYIMKAEEAKAVAEADKVEEAAGDKMDDDFLGGFDAFDEDD